LAISLFGALGCRTRTSASAEMPPPPLRHAVTCPVSPPGCAAQGSFYPGQTAHGSLAASQADSYEIHLAVGTYIRLLADQSHLDLALCLYSPERSLQAALDSPNGQQEPEELLWQAADSGAYTLVVRSLAAAGPPRSYDLQLAQVPHPSTVDRARLAAVLAAAEGEELRRSSVPSDWPAARERYQAALAVWERLGDRYRQADLQARLGRLERDRLDNPRQALAAYERARLLFTQLGAGRRAALTVAALGKTSMLLGRPENALAYQRQALALFSALGDRREQAVADNEIAFLCELRGDWQGALEGYGRSLQLWNTVDDRAGRATTLHNRGLLYTSLGEYRLALDDFEQARRLLVGRPRELAATLSAMGNTHTAAGEPAEAMALLREALALRVATGDAHGKAVTQSALGLALRKAGHRSEAVEWHRQALAAFADLGDPDEIARAQVNLGASLREAGQLRAAASLLDVGVSGARLAADAEALTAGLLALSETMDDLGQPLAALPLLRQALQSVEALRRSSPGPTLRSAFLATKQDLYAFGVELLMELDRQYPAHGFRSEALDVSERAKARSFLDELGATGAPAGKGVPFGLLAEQRRLAAAVRLTDSLLRRARADEPSTESPSVLARHLRSLLRELDLATTKVQAISPANNNALAGAEPLSTRSVQRKVLDAGTLLLHYKLGAKRSYLWAVTPTSLDAFVLPPRQVLEPLIRRAQLLLAEPENSLYRPQIELTLKRLSAALLGPAEALLGNKRLLIVGDGALQLLPFAALPREPGALRTAPLVTAHEIVTLPSVSALALLTSQHAGRTPAPKPLAIVADPVFSADDPRVHAPGSRSPAAGQAPFQTTPFGRLRHTREEAEAIAALAPYRDVLMALDFAASRDLVLSGTLGEYRILHFATHGEINSDHAELSHLVLSLVDREGHPEDGLLYAQEVYGLRLPADLVVLSGCETALGKEIRGEGLVGLPQAFLHAGAAQVVASLWKVDDRATAELFKSFYRYLLAEHKSPSKALQDAQIERWRREPRSYQWAAFISVGSWR
jgi:CHAT domain-containing protein